MNRAYWNRLAATYSDDVIEITAIDTNGVLVRTAEMLGGTDTVAADFGCGVGATTRAFAPFFKRIVGVDFSPQLLDEAKRRTNMKNVSYALADLAGPRPPDIEVDVGFCVNCLIAPSYEMRFRIARNLARRVRGRVAFVVPSWESVLRTYQTLVRLDVADGNERRAAGRRVAALAAHEVRSLVDGVVEVGGEPTKHYLSDEIAQFLADAGFLVDTIERVEYPWDIDLDVGRPRSKALLGLRSPWDWLLVCYPVGAASVGAASVGAASVGAASVGAASRRDS
jgi:SAM-dependent methyltransferase